MSYESGHFSPEEVLKAKTVWCYHCYSQYGGVMEQDETSEAYANAFLDPNSGRVFFFCGLNCASKQIDPHVLKANPLVPWRAYVSSEIAKMIVT